VVINLMGGADVQTRVAAFDELLRRFRELPGVRAAGGASRIPLGRGWAPNGTFIILNAVTDPVDDAILAQAKPDTSRIGAAMYRIASDGYFETMGIPVLRGRSFEARDITSAPHVAVITKSLADQRWPSEDPIGKVVYFGNMDGIRVPMTIAGIVGDVREENLWSTPEPTLYATYRQRPNQAWQFNFVLATNGNAAAMMNPARQVVRDVMPNAPPRIAAIEEIVGRSVAGPRFVLTLAGVFGAAALLLAALGIYSVISYLVAQRARELSIRVALGATSRGILVMVMRQGVVLAAAGVALGAVVSVAATRSFQSMLFGVQPGDPLTFAGVIGLLVVVAAAASWIPASRAARAQPGDAMRDA
jgi:putative ABC transport system permease protein